MSGETNTPLPLFTPAFPFDNTSGADAILRSSDGADFHIHRAILGLVSPVFRDMFTLPQPTSSPDLPVIPVQEDAILLDRALRFFYPGAPSVPATLDELREIIQVLVAKYDMETLVPAAKSQLERHLVASPVAVYAIAATHQWKDLAIAAAKETLKSPLRVLDEEAPPELNHIPAATYHNLLRYHYRCGIAAKSLTKTLRHIPAANDYVWFSCGSCAPDKLNWYLSDNAARPTRLWFTEYLKSLGEVVGETPALDIRNHQTMTDALASAAICTLCRGKVFNQLPQFVSSHLTMKIKAAVDEVWLVLVDCRLR
ncbi:hypothetical protein B0H11DRAFT_1725569 [Mycena galericulata]|nr:hypothetical protein B0H11DRAFT_1725569 [Mycena galericulata]